jgi:gamma-glutamyltranspeptidase / glutathione hydrolase
MYHSGVGGGGFMLVRGSNGSYEFIDFRETAPAAAFEDMYKNNTEASVSGGLARCGSCQQAEIQISTDSLC